MTCIHDNKLNNLSESNLLHDLLNTTKTRTI